MNRGLPKLSYITTNCDHCSLYFNTINVGCVILQQKHIGINYNKCKLTFGTTFFIVIKYNGYNLSYNTTTAYQSNALSYNTTKVERSCCFTQVAL